MHWASEAPEYAQDKYHVCTYLRTHWSGLQRCAHKLYTVRSSVTLYTLHRCVQCTHNVHMTQLLSNSHKNLRLSETCQCGLEKNIFRLTWIKISIRYLLYQLTAIALAKENCLVSRWMLKWFGLFGFGCQQNSWFSTSCLSRGLTHQTHQNQKLPAPTHLYHGTSPQTARPLLPTDCSQRPFITGPGGFVRGRAWKQKDGPAHTSRALRLPGEPPRPFQLPRVIIYIESLWWAECSSRGRSGGAQTMPPSSSPATQLPLSS